MVSLESTVDKLAESEMTTKTLFNLILEIFESL